MTAGRRPRVLLVEDHAALRRFVQLALQPLGLMLSAVDSVAAAGRRIAQEGLPDLLLTDLMLPDGSGLDLVRRLRDAGHGPQRLPVIVLSAAVPLAQREALTDLQALEVLIKPVPVADLLASVERALAPAAALTAAAPAADRWPTTSAATAGSTRPSVPAASRRCRAMSPRATRRWPAGTCGRCTAWPTA